MSNELFVPPGRPTTPSIVVTPVDQTFSWEAVPPHPCKDVSLLPIISPADQTPLDNLLRKHIPECTADSQKPYWPHKLLRHILSRERILGHLRLQGLGNEAYIEHIAPQQCKLGGTGIKNCLKVFSILLIIEKSDHIRNFIESGITDEELPLAIHYQDGAAKLCRRGSPWQTLECFLKWSSNSIEAFETAQWKFLAPYFELDQKRANHYQLNDATSPIWSSLDDETWEGGFGTVTRVTVDPLSHGFWDLLDEIQIDTSEKTNHPFALKLLKDRNGPKDLARFQSESDLLRKFNGLVHRHLVTLLATFTYRNQYYFLFPWADSALDSYWEKTTPVWSQDLIRWVAKQLPGIMGATESMHNPTHLHSSQTSAERRYALHGDIKPENILLFRTKDDSNGTLVLSDMGMSQLHRDTSRSNIPNSSIPKTPGYRPPECDVQGAVISRAYDIWTLGCVFLEFLTWLLGGYPLLKEFENMRTTRYITRMKTSIFFDLLQTKDKTGYVLQVKLEVTKWFVRLHRHERCSEFVHDALDLIEEYMLVVISRDRKRGSAQSLRNEFEKLYQHCSEPGNESYFFDGVPRKIRVRARTGVWASLNLTAQETIQQRGEDLGIYDYVEPRKSLLAEEWINQ